MQADDPNAAPSNHAPVDDSAADRIPSVNERGRRRGGQLAPFFAMGGIALVVLIGGLATFNVLKAKLSAPKPKAEATRTAASTGLVRTFDTETPPPLPGAQASSSMAARNGASCADGSSGNMLRGQDGVVVRNASGHAVRVCADGQVAGVTPPDPPAARPIPVVRRQDAAFSPQAPEARPAMPERRRPDAPMMLTGGVSGDGASSVGFPAPAASGGFPGAAADSLLATQRSGSLETDLIPSRTPLVQAARMKDLSLLLPKGRTIDCGLSMRIISSLAGQASCVVTHNVYSANGKVVLIERGSEAVGEYRSGVSIGQKRLFVLWTRILTPDGVVIALDSPGADELGATGLTGRVDDHWFERIGSAFLLSTIQDVLQYKITEAQARSGGGTLVLGNTAQASSQMAERVLETTINIPPTLYKAQGDRAVIYVARDLDFSNVYALRSRP